jgi:hypothetical protein
MIVEEIRSIKSGKKELRQFGITIGIVLGLLGIWFFWVGKEGKYLLIIGAILFSSLGLIFPLVLKPFQKLWMTLAILMGWLVTRVIVTVLFYLVVTPIGIFAKLCGKKFLNVKLDKSADSYWIKRTHTTPDKQAYEKQF